MNILVSDFDSTMTQRDFYQLVRDRWPVPPEDDPWQKYMAGQMTHFEALAEIFSRIRTTEPSLLELVDAMEIDPALASSLRTLRERGWEVVVASAGCAWYIDYLLAKAGASVTVHANPGTFDAAAGLRMELPRPSPFFSPMTGVDKVAIVQDALRRGDRVAFAGDGPPDLNPSLLVPAEMRFARGWLAEALEKKGEKFHAFKKWSDIVEILAC
jgi:2,3-diketo-5-methylthio-1-phosphopentane phosphatase